MKKTLILAVALAGAALTAPAADAQVAAAPPATWVSGYVQMFNEIGGFHDPGTASSWEFGDNAFGGGLVVQRELGGLLIGVDLAYARTQYEATPTGPGIEIVTTGDAGIATAFLTGRMAYGGGGDLGLYLTGGVGTIAYELTDLADWNADFALRAGTGLEYRFNARRTLFLEWGRVWGYHEKEGVRGGTARHSVLKLGTRFGF